VASTIRSEVTGPSFVTAESKLSGTGDVGPTWCIRHTCSSAAPVSESQRCTYEEKDISKRPQVRSLGNSRRFLDRINVT
jgi:hypothetical protein